MIPRVFYIFILSLAMAVVTASAQSDFAAFDEGARLLSLGRYVEAQPVLQKAESELERQKPALRNKRQQLYGMMAQCCMEIGNYDKALTYFSRQESLFPSGSPALRSILLNKSDVMLLTGQYSRAESLLRSIRSDEVKQYVNLASALGRQERFDEAISVLDSAARRVFPTSPQAATIFQNKAFLLSSIGRNEEAISLYRSAQVIQRKANLPAFYQTEGNLALAEAYLVHNSEGIYDSVQRQALADSAISRISRAIAWQRDNLSPSHPDLSINLRKRAEILLMQGDKRAAAVAFKEYFSVEKHNIKANFLYMTEKQRTDYWASRRPLLAECFATGSADPAFLYDVAVFSKSVLLQSNLDVLRAVSSNRELKTIYDNILSLRKKAGESSQPAAIEETIEKEERRLMSRARQLGDFVSQLDASASAVAKALERTADRAVEIVRYYDGSARYAALILGKNRPSEFVPLFSEDSILQRPLHDNLHFVTLREALGSQRLSDKDRLYADTVLGKIVWGEIMKRVPRSGRVYFSPDGIFHLLAAEYLNFARPDCEIFRLSSTLRLARHNGQLGASPSLLLIGGVNYDGLPADTNATADADRSASRQLAADGLPPAVGGGYSFLRGSLAEVDSIAAASKIQHLLCKKLSGELCGEAKVKHLLPYFSQIHISTHGYSSSEAYVRVPLCFKDAATEDLSLSRSAILLSGANSLALQVDSNLTREDGVLSAREVSALDLRRARVVVLSACQSGLGRLDAEGVAGMPRGLKKAGAGAIVVSLWNVDDRATQLLMCRMYSLMSAGVGPRSALRKAQQYLRTVKSDMPTSTNGFNPATGASRRYNVRLQTDYNKPRYWAPFIIIDAI